MAKDKKKNVEKPNGKLESWVNDNIVEDEEICFNAASVANKRAFDKFTIAFGDDSDPRTTCMTLLGFYGVIWNTLWEVIQRERDTKDNFIISIANCIEIGFVNNDNDDTEKSGSFVPVIHRLNGKPDYPSDTYNDSSAQKCQKWMTSNIKTNKEFFNRVNEAGQKKLKDQLDIALPEKDIIIPCWVLIHETIMDQLENWFSLEFYKADDPETYETMVNFCGCYNVALRMGKNNETELGIFPNVSSKVSTKDDSRAKKED